MAELVDVDVESVNVHGDGVARLGRSLIAVPFTIPGERVRVRVERLRAGAVSATLVEVLAPSAHRVNPRCRHFGLRAEGGRTCGGCSWQHIAYPRQLELKTDLVTRLVREKVSSAPAARPMLAATPLDAPWGYRNKVHFAVDRKGPGALVMGHYARFSRRLIDVAECPVHDERGNALAFALRDACEWADTHEVKSIAVRSGQTTSETMATIVVSSETDKRIRAASRRAMAGQHAPTSLHVNIHPRGDALIFGERTRHVAGPERLREDLGGASFLVSPTSFFQTNVRAAQMLLQQVLASIPMGAAVLDLYAGAGLFALPLAARGHEVVAVEENRGAVADGVASLRLSRIPEARCRFLARPVEAALKSRDLSSQHFGAIVLDPPREGCQAPVLDRLLHGRAAKTIVYISCDPQSLARDLARITASGYEIRSMQPVDMFPHTPHVETVAVLDRRS